MSIEERVQQFVADAQRPRDARTPGELAKLRKFLFKNQAHRFAEKEQERLFQAVQAYCAAFSSTSASGEDDDNPALGLLEDALKMPFTVFSSGHKTRLLKLHAKMTGDAGPGPGPGSGAAAGAQVRLQVFDVSAGGVVSFMDAEGDTVEVAAAGGGGDVALLARVRELFEGGEEVYVLLSADRKTIVALAE